MLALVETGCHLELGWPVLTSPVCVAGYTSILGNDIVPSPFWAFTPAGNPAFPSAQAAPAFDADYSR